MEKIIIFGTSMFSSVLYQTIIQENSAEVLGFTLNKQYISENTFEGLNVVPFEDLNSAYNMSEVSILISTGYGKMNSNRETVYNECKNCGYNIFTFVSKKANVYTDNIGEGSILLPMSFVGPYVSIGKCCIIWNMTCISHHSVIGDFCHFAGGTMVGGGTNFGTKCFIGMNCTIKNCIEIASKTFVSANSYIHENTDANKGYSGNPATQIPKVNSDLLIRFVK